MNWDVWGPPLGVLLVGLVLGTLLTWRSRGRPRRDSQAERQARKDSLMDQLRSLEADRSKIADAVFADRYSRLLDEAAAALRELEQVDEDSTAADEQQEDAPVERRAGRAVAWVVLIFGFFAGLVYWLTEYSSLRGADGSLTGTALSGPALRAEEKRIAEETLETNPSDLTALNKLSYLALEERDYRTAMTFMERARKVAPEDAEVQTHLAILQLSIGMDVRAEQALASALEVDPTMSKAWFWSGVVQMRKGNRTEAVGLLERALEHALTDGDRLAASRALLEARRPPPVEHLRGQLRVADGAAAPSDGVVFVMVRRSADGGGPPAAAVRLDPRGLPGSFGVTDRDLMMGGAWPDQVWVEARWDADGNPSTKSSADLSTSLLGPFASGDVGLELILDGGGASTTSTAEASASARLQGQVTLADGVTPPAGGMVFIIVRRTETPAGPPAAALRVSPSSVPGAFTVGDGDLMMGGAWPEQVWVQARWDEDGNAMTRTDGDVSSPVVGPFAAGADQVELVLGQP